MTIGFDDFLKVDIRVGTIVDAQPFPEARRPAYRLRVDFGPDLGVKKTSAQITERYALEDLPGRQVAAVVNFPPKQIGPVMSEVLVLGFPDLQAGRAQNRFYTELENWLSSVTNVEENAGAAALTGTDQLSLLTARLANMQDAASTPRQTQALASLAEGVQGLVQSMRSEQQMMRDWVDGQAKEQKAMRDTLEKLSKTIAKLDKGS